MFHACRVAALFVILLVNAGVVAERLEFPLSGSGGASALAFFGDSIIVVSAGKSYGEYVDGCVVIFSLKGGQLEEVGSYSVPPSAGLFDAVAVHNQCFAVGAQSATSPGDASEVAVLDPGSAPWAKRSPIEKAGIVEVFCKEADKFARITLVSPEPYKYARFGSAITLSADNIFVGEPTSLTRRGDGRVHVFDYSGKHQDVVAMPEQVLTTHRFGTSVAYSAGVLLIGAPPENCCGGAIYAYTRHDGVWELVSTFDNPLPYPKSEVAYGGRIVAHGSTIVTAGSGANLGDGVAEPGAVDVLAMADSNLIFEERLDGREGAFGNDASLAYDGQYLLGRHDRQFHVFVKNGAGWQAKETFRAAPNRYLGSAVAIRNGRIAFIEQQLEKQWLVVEEL